MTENWDMLGHRWAVDLLKGYIKHGRTQHAYLFTGPRGVGRRTLALRFAQALNAENPPAPGEYDPQSLTSRQIERMQHPDLSVVQRQLADRDIRIEYVRDLQKMVSLSPYSAAYRVALLLNFEEASPGASNALLKTLEEPPGKLILILTAESGEALLPTITSRCEILRLRPVSLEETSRGLHNIWGIEPDQASLLAHISNGRPGYARYLHQNPEELAQRSEWLDDHQELLRADRVSRFAYADKISKDKDRFQQALQVWLTFWRDVMLAAAHTDAPLTNIDREKEITSLAERIEVSTAHHIAAAIENTITGLRKNINARLAAEVLLLEMQI